MKIGIVGLGHVSKWHQKAINKIEDIAIEGVCDNDPNKIQAQQRHIPATTELGDLLAIKKIDTMLVAVPPSEQFAVARQCLEAGKNVLLEKPGTQNREELEKLYEIADETNQRLVVALHAAFGKEVEYFVFVRERNLSLTLNKKFGALIGFKAKFLDPYVQNGAVLLQARALGGSWLDSAVNALSIIAQFISLEHLTVFRKYFDKIDCYPADVGARVWFQFQKHGNAPNVGRIETSWDVGVNSKVTTFYFENATVKLDHSNQVVSVNDVVIKDFSSGDERLTTHYIGVFRDYYNFEKRDNRELALGIHSIISSALK